MQLNNYPLVWASIGILILIVMVGFLVVAYPPQEPDGVSVNTLMPSRSTATATPDAGDIEATDQAREMPSPETTSEAGTGEPPAEVSPTPTASTHAAPYTIFA